nr:uncharacterized protein LOC113828479 [Penaeus vannamei]
MSALSYIRRRVFGKSWSLLKCFHHNQCLQLLLLPFASLHPLANIFHNQHHLLTTSITTAYNLYPSPGRPPIQTIQTPESTRTCCTQASSPVSQSSNIDSNSNSKSGSNSKAKTTKEKKEQHESDSVRNSAWSMAKANITDNHKVRYKGHAITENTVTLTLMSSADKVFMSLNKREIYRNLQDRGIHAVVLNQHSGRVTAKTRFRHVQPRRRGGVGGVRRRRSRWRIIVFAVLKNICQ